MIDKNIKYLEAYEDDGVITFYFSAPAEYSQDFVPLADETILSLEFPIGSPEANNTTVEIGGAVNGNIEEWRDISMPYDEVEELLKLGIANTLLDVYGDDN